MRSFVLVVVTEDVLARVRIEEESCSSSTDTGTDQAIALLAESHASTYTDRERELPGFRGVER